MLEVYECSLKLVGASVGLKKGDCFHLQKDNRFLILCEHFLIYIKAITNTRRLF